jgi:hypothetical protein
MTAMSKTFEVGDHVRWNFDWYRWRNHYEPILRAKRWLGLGVIPPVKGDASFFSRAGAASTTGPSANTGEELPHCVCFP